MSNRPTYVDYTPASEKSIYFDAPIMHFFSKKSSSVDDHSTVDDTRVPSRAGASSPDRPLSDAPSEGKRRSSVLIPRDPVVREEPTQSESDDEDGEPSTRRAYQLRDDGPVEDTAHPRKSIASDSGYGSPTSHNRASAPQDEMKPIPVVWNENAEGQSGKQWPRVNGGSPAKRASSLRSFRSQGIDRGDGNSIHTTPSGRYTPASERRRRVSLSGGSFASGPGTVGPNSAPDLDETLLSRSKTAESQLSKKQKLKVAKAELKEGKRIAKVIKSEGKAEKQSLEIAVKELAELQKTQKQAVKEESKVYSAHAKALRNFHKYELEFLAAKAKFDRAQAELQAQEEAREAARQYAAEATEMLQEKNREVEFLRAQKAADDRERELKLRQLAGKA